jgi:hypothetical protein
MSLERRLARLEEEDGPRCTCGGDIAIEIHDEQPDGSLVPPLRHRPACKRHADQILDVIIAVSPGWPRDGGDRNHPEDATHERR